MSQAKSQVVMYATGFCPFCIRARHLLTGKGVQFEEIRVDKQPHLRAEMTRLSGSHTVPQIWIGDIHVGGCDELVSLERSGDLDPLLVEAGVVCE